MKLLLHLLSEHPYSKKDNRQIDLSALRKIGPRFSVQMAVSPWPGRPNGAAPRSTALQAKTYQGPAHDAHGFSRKSNRAAPPRIQATLNAHPADYGGRRFRLC